MGSESGLGVGLFANPKPGAATSVLTTIGLFLVITWTTLSLRIWVRTSLARSFGWDDAVLLLSTMTFTGFCTMLILAETTGGGPHVHDMAIPAVSRLVGMVVSIFGLYIMTMVFLKISLGIFYLRFISQHWQRVVIYTTVALNTLYGVLLFFVAIFQCGDPTLYLSNELKAICMPNGPLYGVQLTGAIVNASTDWILALLPIFVLAKANMPKRTKASAGCIILLGCSGSIISLIRIRYIKDLRPSPDFFRGVTDIAIWSIAECGICISAAAAAALRVLFRGLAERTQKSITRVLSLGSRVRNGKEDASNDRHSETSFGDWGVHTARHEMKDVEVPIEKSSGPPPINYSHRVPSKMGVSRHDLRAPVVDATLPIKDTRPSARAKAAIEDSRLKSFAECGTTTMPNSGVDGQSEPQMSSEQTVRDKHRTRSTSESSIPVLPPTPTLAQKPQRALIVDVRRVGSPDSRPVLARYATPTAPLSPNGTLF